MRVKSRGLILFILLVVVLIAHFQVVKAEDENASVIGSWMLGMLSGGQFDSTSGKYEGGASGMGQVYTFRSDGSYRALVIWSSTLYFEGKYSVDDGVLALTERMVEESQDGGKTWGSPEILPDTLAYFTIETDDMGPYLLIGGEGAAPPLVDKTNAMKYRFAPAF